MYPRFSIHKSAKNGQYYVRFRGANSEIVWSTETYTTKTAAYNAISFARTHAATAPIVDLT